MNIRRFRALHQAGASYAEIAAEVGCDWRTVKKYLAEGSPAVPPGDQPHPACPPGQPGQPGRQLARLGPDRLGPVPAPGRHQPDHHPAQPAHGTAGAATPRPPRSHAPAAQPARLRRPPPSPLDGASEQPTFGTSTASLAWTLWSST